MVKKITHIFRTNIHSNGSGEFKNVLFMFPVRHIRGQMDYKRPLQTNGESLQRMKKQPRPTTGNFTDI